MEVKVWNDGHKDWKEEFKGEFISIPRGGFITMSRSRAVKFLSQYAPFYREGNEDSLNRKRLRMEEDPELKAAATDQPFRFSSTDGKKFRTKQGVENHEKAMQGAMSGRKTKAS